MRQISVIEYILCSGYDTNAFSCFWWTLRTCFQCKWSNFILPQLIMVFLNCESELLSYFSSFIWFRSFTDSKSQSSKDLKYWKKIIELISWHSFFVVGSIVLHFFSRNIVCILRTVCEATFIFLYAHWFALTESDSYFFLVFSIFNCNSHFRIFLSLPLNFVL